ncbi:MAG: hypothetical protein MJY82_08605 [Fibrobacter sp.]|nr:hypothetical protein [Fibrobacter sp.]
MKKFMKTLSAVTIASFAGAFTACGEDSTAGVTEEAAGIAVNSSDSEDEDLSSSSKKATSSSSKDDASSSSKVNEPAKFSGKVSGVSQKGPFLVGSSITLHEIEGESFDLSGRTFVDKIKNDKGEFELSFKELSSNYALIVADGFYRNENSGKKSTASIKLNALSDLADRKTVNVNLLTHLEYERVKYLVLSKKVEYAKAKAQAEKEILEAFGMAVEDGAVAEDLSIFGESKNDGALLALSVLMQGTSGEGAFSERLALVAQDLEEDGKIDDKRMLTDIADEVALMDLDKVRKNIEDWKLSSTVPAFESFVESYWTENYGIGACTAKDIAKTAKNTNKLSKNFEKTYVCDADGWRLMTKDEAAYGTCAAGEDGKRFEKSRICDDGEWRSLTADESMGACTEEKIGETAAEENELSEGFEKTHVCDAEGWRLVSDLEGSLGLCLKTSKVSGKVENNKFYVCADSKWSSVDRMKYDMLTLECSKDGEIIHSEVNDLYYVCKGGKLTAPTLDDFSIDKEFSADIWDGAKDSKVNAGSIAYEIVTRAIGVDAYDSKGVMVAKKVDNELAFPVYDENGVSGSLEDKGLKYNYALNGKGEVRYLNSEFIVTDEGHVDASTWEGLCIVYASSVPMKFFIHSLDMNMNYAVIPASMELNVVNLKWNEFDDYSYGKSYEDIVKNLQSVSVSVERSDDYPVLEKGAAYIAGIGKYNGCSIK